MKRLIASAVLCVVVGIIISGCQTVTTDSPKLDVGKRYEIYLDSDRYIPERALRVTSFSGILESQSKEWLYIKDSTSKYLININHVTCISEILDK